MKALTLVFTIIAAAVIGGTIVYLIQQKHAVPSAPSATVAPAVAGDATPAPAPKTTVTTGETTPASTPANTPVAADAPAPAPTKSDAAIALDKTIDELLAPHITAAQKHELLQQLIKSGQLDEAITDLKQRALDNPNDPEIPTTLGEAQLNKVAQLHAAGADINDMGILAMQADQSFNAALKIDPQNYEAQLVKSISMTYWPADPTRDPQVVQTLTSLIDRQESMPSDPGFAQPYVYLGNEYQKLGQPDKAIATWQLGLQKFPNDPTLQQKLNGQ
jgi:tetratricopeptide (TPR) repeat protein